MKGCVGVYLVELVRILLQYKLGTIFRPEWFWRMEEFMKRNGKGAWLREIEKVLRRFNASLEWLMERISLRDEEMDGIRADTKMEEREKSETLKAWRTKSIAEVLEEVEVLLTLTSSTNSPRLSPRCF